MEYSYRAGLHKLLFHQEHINKIKAGEVVAPIHVTIFPTLACQLNCAYCFCRNQYKDGEELSLEDFTTGIDTLAKYGTKAIEFAGGGEPLMWSHFNKAVELAYSKGLKLSLITNGIALKDIPIDILEKFVWIRISVTSIENIKNVFTSHIPDKVKVSLSYTIDKLNKRDVRELYKFAKFKNLITRIAVAQPATEKDTCKIKEYIDKFGLPFFFSAKEFGTPQGCYMAWVRGEIDWKGYYLPCPAVMFTTQTVDDKFRLCHVKDLDQWLINNRVKDLGFKCSFCDCGKEINDFIHTQLKGIDDVEFI